MTAHIESIIEGWDEILPIVTTAHYDELSVHKQHGYAPNPNKEGYFQLEREGKLLYIALRREGRLIGYFVGFLVSDLHYQVPSLIQDIIYVVPSERGKRGGLILVNTVIAEWKRRELKHLRMGSKTLFEEKTGHNLDRLLGIVGFEKYETMHALWL